MEETLKEILIELKSINKKLDVGTPSLEKTEEDSDIDLMIKTVCKLSKSYKIDNILFESRLNKIQNSISSINNLLTFVSITQLIIGLSLILNAIFK